MLSRFVIFQVDPIEGRIHVMLIEILNRRCGRV